MSAKDLDDRNSTKIEAGTGGEAEEEVSLSLWRWDRAVWCAVCSNFDNLIHITIFGAFTLKIYEDTMLSGRLQS